MIDKSNTTFITWNKVDLESDNKNLPEPDRYIYYRAIFKDKCIKTNAISYGIGTGVTTLQGMKCENYKSLPEETIYVRTSDLLSYPLTSGFEWAYAETFNEAHNI